MGLGLTNFALEGGVSGRTSLKIEGKGNSEMTLLSAYITLKMQTADARVTLDPQVKTNTQAFIACSLASPLPFPSTSIPCLQH